MRDAFVKEETIEAIVSGSGPFSITTWVYGVAAGRWNVSASLVRPRLTHGMFRGSAPAALGGQSLPEASWSWLRWSVSSRSPGQLSTRWALLAPLARTPAVMPGIYTALAVVAIAGAIAMQTAILGREQVPTSGSLGASGIALAVGLAAAKVWYAVLHPGESIIRGGWAVDGFLIAAPIAAVLALLVVRIPVGLYLDATTPGLFLAVAIGRVGCFLTGCCAGRCTSSRWGIWSSDRRIGARRIPTQLLESAAGLAIAASSLVFVIALDLPVHGVVFMASFAAYAVVRQFLLRLRAEQRRSSRTVPATAFAASLVLLFAGFAAATQTL